MLWRCAPSSVNRPLSKPKAHASKYRHHDLIYRHTQIETYTHNIHSVEIWWLLVHDMHSFASDLISGMMHNRNGNNMAHTVPRLAEKINGKMADEYGCAPPPPPTPHAQPGYNPECGDFVQCIMKVTTGGNKECVALAYMYATPCHPARTYHIRRVCVDSACHFVFVGRVTSCSTVGGLCMAIYYLVISYSEIS